MDVSDRDPILQKIAKAEKQLANLLWQKETAEAELQSLREQLAKGRHRQVRSPIYRTEGFSPGLRSPDPWSFDIEL